ncbi:hypothetical protein chiPu_0010326 [Chiloscyllium punctatum]|uniref:Uncharacterized protein n=1 Tax=Chiloscyllium punctatum TaxID=137246 RepID=A0A401SN86_CHIPU|nr:hypothetical protein [Chiloscyllium punctatum]
MLPVARLAHHNKSASLVLVGSVPVLGRSYEPGSLSPSGICANGFIERWRREVAVTLVCLKFETPMRQGLADGSKRVLFFFKKKAKINKLDVQIFEVKFQKVTTDDRNVVSVYNGVI